METLFIGRNMVFLPETDSTNSYAISMLKNVKLPEGTVVHTANQTKGKGQRMSEWKAQPAQNLTISIVLNPSFLELKNQFYLYQISALACYDTTAELIDNRQFDIKIKWPNDILVDKRKIAGVLIENNVMNNQINWSVVGIGLNVNQLIFDDLFHATSMQLATGINFEVNMVLDKLCLNFEKHYLSLMNNKLDLIKKNYLKHFFGLNTFLDFELNGQIKNLKVMGISDTGLFQLEEKAGKTFELDVKEIKWLY